MKAFAALLERLAFTNGRNAKIAILQNYLARTPDPDRGLALGVITGDLEMRHISPSLLRRMIATRCDPELFELSYHFVGDLAETIALLWPDPDQPVDIPLHAAVETLSNSGRNGEEIAGLLDQLPKDSRLALLKLGTGNLRLGLSARLARTALAEMSGRELTRIEELWHGVKPPYGDLFAWLDGGPEPQAASLAPFRPVMLSTPTTLDELSERDPEHYLAEWKWDGIRVQIASEGGERRLYARSGDDITEAFPDLLEAMTFTGTLDGELLVARDGEIAPFADLQRRLGRKSVSRSLLADFPAHLRLYDLLLWEGEDLRPLPLIQRRARLEAIRFDSPKIDLSPLLSFRTWGELAALREAPPQAVIEGLMIKDHRTPYQGGRPRGPWFKWKREPMRIDAVLLYAQAGHGKRSGFYSDFTLGVWHEGALVPVAKAYFGFTDEELRFLDQFVRKNTLERFGPVRRVKPTLVLEIAFEGISRSPRHKSGIALRFPRISRIRQDKPASEADQLQTLEALIL